MLSFTKTHKLVIAALFTSLGIVLSIVENYFSFVLPIPGAKIGLANIATLLALYFLNFRLALVVVGLRVLLSALLLGTFLASSFFISSGGALVSLFAMQLLKSLTPLSILGVSLAGAALHNLGQLAIASLLISSQALFYFLPLLLLFSLPAGFSTGYLTSKILYLLNKKKDCV